MHRTNVLRGRETYSRLEELLPTVCSARSTALRKAPQQVMLDDHPVFPPPPYPLRFLWEKALLSAHEKTNCVSYISPHWSNTTGANAACRTGRTNLEEEMSSNGFVTFCCSATAVYSRFQSFALLKYPLDPHNHRDDSDRCYRL